MNLKRTIENIKMSYDKAGQQYFNLFHDELETHHFDQKLLKDFITGLDPQPTICDFGCGPAAQYGRFLLPFCQKVYALDISPRNIEIAKKQTPSIHFKCENMLETSFENSSIDGIISFYAIFHIPKTYDYKFFEETFRILKPRGKLLVMTHKGDLEKIFTELWDRSDLKLFANFHNEEELTNSAKACGFEIESCFSRKSYYGYPEERIILTLKKPF